MIIRQNGNSEIRLVALEILPSDWVFVDITI